MNAIEARRLARHLMDAYALDDWSFQFDRSKRRFGVCKHQSKTIGLSFYLVRMNPEAEVKNTILHEIAHAIAGHKAGHGPEWKEVCRCVGADPVRCYSSDEVKAPPPNWIGTCTACGKEYERLRLSKRARASSCSVCSKGTYQERYRITWRRVR